MGRIMSKRKAGIRYHDYANVGVDISVPGGLIVPVVKDAETMSVAQIAGKAKKLVDKAHIGTLTDEERRRSVFLIKYLRRPREK